MQYQIIKYGATTLVAFKGFSRTCLGPQMFQWEFQQIIH